MFSAQRRFVRPIMAVAVLLALPACDAKDPLEGVDLILEVDDAPVAVGASMQVVPNQVSSVSINVGASSDIKSVQEITSIMLDPTDFSYTQSAGLRAASSVSAAASGNINVVLRIGNVGLAALLTVQDNVVTNVAPRQLLNLTNFSAWKQAVLDIVENMPESQRPDFSTFENMNPEEVKQELVDLLGGTFQLHIHVHTSNPELTGTLTLSEFSLGGTFVF